ncbi:exonuclease SbcC [Thermodesulfitimonas autotrophica]|uniref:Exonuclease SbcC n=1 Tax=Thermodesulfitimonas autotrophica TaxID=1894989 RepID=A0A3N5AGQ7_9THEO|nr:AAA family ATPase [Thermodesulfitimonas autotrophica]RPF43040.1 exonuclease SbcC [Thermodesulfitimonas autotrophica]
MRLKRLILENFQSHRYTEIDLAPAVTVLLGESDQGKSAVVRALRWLFYNRPQGANFIRVGADYCRVTAEFAGGLVIVRERRGKTNRYVIRRPGQEPLVLEGFGREVPEQVEELTGVRPLKLEGASFELHVAHQLDPPFLLTESPAVRARAVGHLSGTHLFDAADRKAARLAAELARLRGELEEKAGALRVQIAGFADLPELEARFEGCADLYRRSEAAAAKVSRLVALREEYGGLCRGMREAAELLRQVPEPEELRRRGETAAQKVSRCLRVRELREARGRALGLLCAVRETLAATATVREAEAGALSAAALIERLAALRRKGGEWLALRSERDEIRANLATLTVVPQAEGRLLEIGERLARLAKLRTLAERRRDTSRHLARVAAALAALDGVPVAGRLWEQVAAHARLAEKLRRLLRDYAATQRQLAAAAGSLAAARKEVAERARELRALLAKAQRCPLCLAPLSAARVAEILRRELGEDAADG